jgi:hypothetical protein
VSHSLSNTMKTYLALSLGLLALAPAHAQVFGPRAANGALLGGIAGAVIGHNSGSLSHNGWQGAAIGAGVGALIGAAADRDATRHAVGVPMASGGYVYRDGYRGANRGGYYGGGAYGGGFAHDGLWLGGIAGGIIGHNSGGNWRHNGWRGAAWGAGAGWLLGSILDANYGYYGYDSGYYGYDSYGYGYPRTVAVAAPQPVVVQAAPQAAPAPQQITIINNYYGNASPMAQANSLFGR